MKQIQNSKFFRVRTLILTLSVLIIIVSPSQTQKKSNFWSSGAETQLTDGLSILKNGNYFSLRKQSTNKKAFNDNFRKITSKFSGQGYRGLQFTSDGRVVISKKVGPAIKTYISKTGTLPQLDSNFKLESSSKFLKFQTDSAQADDLLVEAECSNSHCLLLLVSKDRKKAIVFLNQSSDGSMIVKTEFTELRSLR